MIDGTINRYFDILRHLYVVQFAAEKIRWCPKSATETATRHKTRTSPAGAGTGWHKPAGEQNREHLPDFLRRWIEEAEKLEREHQQPEPVVVQEPVEKPVDKQAQRKAASIFGQGGYAEQSLQNCSKKSGN
ncbi:MAG: hypothetical protein R3C26_07340 [Calditrichia bacterium]